MYYVYIYVYIYICAYVGIYYKYNFTNMENF